LPVSPVGAATPELVYLLFWPVYDGIAVPAGLEERRARLRGYAFGSYRIVALLDAAIRDTPEIVETIRFAITAAAPARGAGTAVAETAAAVYSSTTRVIHPAAAAPAPSESPAVRIARDFTVFGQRWALTFDYAPAAVAALRASDAWGWLVAGLLLTASLVFYLVRERGRTAVIAALVEERTAELRRTSAQLHQAQKMEEIGNLTGGMAHDFNNLLSIVIGNADLLKDRVKDDATAGQLADGVLQAGLRGAELTRQLLAFARRQPLVPRPTDVNELAGGMIRLLRRTLGENIEIKLVTAPDVWPVMIDPAQLSSAIANLATNARDAMPDGGMLTVETRNASLDSDYAKANPDVVPGDFALLEVSDTGSGMTPATLARAFEPFFSTKEAGRGTGLGLSMVFGFVKQSRGHVKIYSEVGVGTTVRLYLPRATTSEEAAAQADAAPAAPAALPKGHGTILAVDDDAEVRRAVTRQLADLGYTVIEAENAPAALALLADTARPIDLLFTDVIMPGGMNGHELARAALALRPSLRVLFTSGYPGTALRNGDTLGHGAHILSKPYRKQHLARKLREVLEA
jgi:signal transduction histidine kinase